MMPAGHPRAIRDGLVALAGLEPGFAALVAEAGYPPSRKRPPGFATVLQIIVAQQVSTASAAAIWTRLAAAVDLADPATLAAAGDDVLRGAGLSRPKMRYARDLAEQCATGAIDFRALARLDDEAAIATLTRIKGIGRWSAEIYLLFALGRPDVWPADDLAVAAAFQHLRGMPSRPLGPALRPHGEAWRPHRSAAALLLWHYYRHRVRAMAAGVVPG